jgi:hypothetical protein
MSLDLLTGLEFREDASCHYAELKHRVAMLVALYFSIGEEVQDRGSFMNHGSASNAEELALGKMFHEDNNMVTHELAMGIVAIQELAMCTEMFYEDNIVVTQELAMGGDMLNEDNFGLTLDILDMESLAVLKQSLTVFAASGNKSTCGSQESTDYLMEIDSGQNRGEDHASTLKHEPAINTAFGLRNQFGMGQNHGEDHSSTMKHEPAIETSLGLRNQSADEGLFGCAPDAVWGTGQAQHERRYEGVHLCLSCRRSLDDDEGQQSEKAFPWRGTDRYVSDTDF